jgi:outer membrane murein-binding lipoprotein Lpp
MTSFLIAACFVAACAAAGSSAEQKMDASGNDPHDAPNSSKQDAQAIDAATPPIDAAEPPIDAPAVGPDASDIGQDCFFNSSCPDVNTCCFFGKCAVGVAGDGNTCVP